MLDLLYFLRFHFVFFLLTVMLDTSISCFLSPFAGGGGGGGESGGGGGEWILSGERGGMGEFSAGGETFPIHPVWKTLIIGILEIIPNNRTIIS